MRFGGLGNYTYLCAPFERVGITYWIGEGVEWSITAVLKTVDVKASGGSNPSLSAVTVEPAAVPVGFFVLFYKDIAGGEEYCCGFSEFFLTCNVLQNLEL